MKKSLLSILLILSLTACSSSVVEDESKTSESVKIGVLLPLSGGASAYGEEMMMVLNHQNSNLETPAELYFEDSKCEAASAVTGFQKLVDIQGVEAILGGFCSSETLAIEPLLEQNDIVALSATSSSPEIEGKSKNLMTLSYSDNVIAQTMAKDIMESNSIAIISEQNDYNIALKNSLESILGEKIITNETFEKNSTDMRNIIEKVKASNPEVLILNPNVGDTSVNLLNQLAESQDFFANVRLVSQETYVADDSRIQAPELAESMTLFAAPNLTSQEVDSFVASLPSTIDTLGVFYSSTASDALENLVRSIQDSRSNGTSVQEELSSSPLSGLASSGKSFDGNNFLQGIKAGKYMITDGKAVLQ